MMLRGARGDCEISVAPVERLAKLSRGRKVVTITDARVKKLHAGKILRGEVIVIGQGEKAKTLATVEEIYHQLTELEADKSALLVGMGGGIVCDVAGFAAATYHRGLDHCLAPTTLLAQVDAAIGGKTGVNLAGYKNIVGAIKQPGAVVCDIRFIETLSEEDMRNGLAEVVKHGAIASAPLFNYVKKNSREIMARELPALRRIVQGSIKIKSSIVQRDETERGERMKLNFGHTIGHALEKACGLPHGEAVSAGMVAECRLAEGLKLSSSDETERLVGALGSLGLRTEMPSVARKDLADAVLKDKKRRGGKMMLPFLSGIGRCRVVAIDVAKLGRALDDLR